MELFPTLSTIHYLLSCLVSCLPLWGDNFLLVRIKPFGLYTLTTRVTLTTCTLGTSLSLCTTLLCSCELALNTATYVSVVGGTLIETCENDETIWFVHPYNKSHNCTRDFSLSQDVGSLTNSVSLLWACDCSAVFSFSAFFVKHNYLKKL